MEILRSIREVINENDIPKRGYHLHVGTDGSGKLEATHTFFYNRLNEKQLQTLLRALEEKNVRFRRIGGMGRGTEDIEIRHTLATREAGFKIADAFAEVQKQSMRNRDRLTALIDRLEEKN